MWNVKSKLQRVGVLSMIGAPPSYAACDSAGAPPHIKDKDLAGVVGPQRSGKTISRVLSLLALGLPVLLFAGVSSAQQYPIMDEVANKVIQKYEQSSCEQLWQKRGQPPSPREQQAIQLLRQDPQMRAAFIGRVAAPIANKMFECGLIP